jgi:hypothetical protein
MTPLVKNPMISHGVVDILYGGRNRNSSHISYEVMDTKLKPSIPGIPIVGEYFEETEDFGDHGGKIVIDNKGIHFIATTIPYGFVPPNTKLEYVDKLDKDGITRTYLRAECYLWTGQYPECQRVIDTGNPQSMELANDTGSWKRIEGHDCYDIEDAIVSKLCILGSEVEPCFEGAAFGKEEPNISYSLDKETYEEFIKTFALQVKEALEEEKNVIDKTKGGLMTMSKVNDPNNPTIIDPKNNSEGEYEKKFNDLTKDFDTLSKNFTKVSEELEEANNKLQKLIEYKNQVEGEKKEQLFNKFKDKNVIEEAELDTVLSKMESLTYEELDSTLCQLYTYAKMALEDEKDNPIATPTPRTFNLNNDNSDMGGMTWEQAVKNKSVDK